MKRTASAVWLGSLKTGKGTLTTESRTLDVTPYSFVSRFESGSGTNPEELLAAAHAGCFTMALSAMLGGEGFQADRLETKAHVNIEQVNGDFTINKIHLELIATIPLIDKDKFAGIVEKAKIGCPVSRLFKAEITLESRLTT